MLISDLTCWTLTCRTTWRSTVRTRARQTPPGPSFSFCWPELVESQQPIRAQHQVRSRPMREQPGLCLCSSWSFALTWATSRHTLRRTCTSRVWKNNKMYSFYLLLIEINDPVYYVDDQEAGGEDDPRNS